MRARPATSASLISDLIEISFSDEEGKEAPKKELMVLVNSGEGACTVPGLKGFREVAVMNSQSCDTV